MKKVAQTALPRPVTHHSQQSYSKRCADDAAKLLSRLFQNFHGFIPLRLWNGSTLRLGKSCSNDSPDAFTLIFNNPNIVRIIVLGRDRFRLAKAYFRGGIDFEGDFFAVLGLKDHLNTIELSMLDKLQIIFSFARSGGSDLTLLPSSGERTSLQAQAVKAHSKIENSDAIRFHYDV